MLLLLLLSSALPGCIARPNRDWEAAPSLQNGETLYACVGESVTFDWRLNPNGSLVNVEEIQFQHQNKADIMESNNNSHPDVLAFIMFPDNRPERVLIPQDPKYAGRVEVNGRVMTIKSLKVTDSGLYSTVVEGHDQKLDTKKTITSTVTLVVADDIMTTDKEVHIFEPDDAFFNETTGRHHKVLECGRFTYNTTPPFDVAWKVPGMSMPRSTEYRVTEGTFRLVLPLRMRTGSYGCSVTKDNAARACAKALVRHEIRLDATETRFWLLGKDLARAQNVIKGNNATTAKGQSSNTAQFVSLSQQLTALENKLTTKDAQLDQLVAQLAAKDGQLDQLIVQLAAKDGQLDQLIVQLAAKDVQLTNKTAELATNISHLKKTLQINKNAITVNKKEIAKKRCETGTKHTFNNKQFYGTKGYGFNIYFGTPFAGTPEVIVSHGNMDVYNDRNFRIKLKVMSVSRTGFRVLNEHWDDTRIHEWSLLWMACYV